jgi:ribosomal protein L40E
MTAQRCPACGGLVSPEAEWCGQCLTPLDATAEGGDDVKERAVPAPGVRTTGIRSDAGRLVWTCPTCEAVNPLEASACATCGTPFGRLFEEPERRDPVDPGRAKMFSLLFPGFGHVAVGRVAEGMARTVVFGFALVMAVTLPVGARGFSLGSFLPLFLASALATVTIYVVSAIDAGRAAAGRAQILSARMLLFGAIGLVILATMGVMLAGSQGSSV